jgi:NAD(P)H dehydrogenase (quinone)
MEKILITGATGELGYAVAKQLIEKVSIDSIAVMVRDSQNAKAKEFTELGVEIRRGDYNDKNSLIQAFSGIDRLYFVSGNDFVRRDQQHQNVVSAAKEAKVKHMLYSSVSLSNFGESSALYGAMSTHLNTESWIEKSGIAYTFLRHNLYTEIIPMFVRSKEQLLATKTIFLPAGKGKTAYISRAELAEAGAIILSQPDNYLNQKLELSGSEALDFESMAGYFTEILGEKISYVSPETEVFENELKLAGVPQEYIGMMTAFGLGMEEGLFEKSYPEMGKILGRKPLSVAAYLKLVYG